jgi:hypothetical protein
MWMRIALSWDFGYVAEPLIGFRPHADTITSKIAAEQGITSFGERYVVYSRINHERRMNFLLGAPLDLRRRQSLRALASLQLLTDEAAWGLPSREVAARLVDVVRTDHRIMLRPAFWHLVAAQLGGRRLREKLAVPRHDETAGLSQR